MEHNGFEYIDLGLPSGTLWATMNVGANNPLGSGLYFMWGATIGFSLFEIKNGTISGNKKNYFKNATLDTDKELSLKNDAANIYMGGKWRIPTKKEVEELVNHEHTTIKCDKDCGMWMIDSNINGNYIVLPSNGYVLQHSNGIRGLGSSLEIITSSCYSSQTCFHIFGSKHHTVPYLNTILVSIYDAAQVRGVVNKNDL